MNKQRKLTISILLVLFTFTGSLFAEKLIPSNKSFWIQSAKEYGRSSKGVWDIPGHPRKFKLGQKIQVWKIKTKNNRDRDRRFYFKHISGDWYRIESALSGRHALAVSGGRFNNGSRIELWSRNSHIGQKFRMKYLGRGKWKIYTSRNYVVCLDNRTSKNGTKVHLWKDHNGPWMEWLLVNPRTKKHFTPTVNKSSNTSSKLSLKESSKTNKLMKQFFRTCSYNQFRKGSKYFIKSLNEDSEAKRFIILADIIKATSQNPDFHVRNIVFLTINYKVKLKSSGFLSKMSQTLLKTAVKKAIENEKKSTVRNRIYSILQRIK